MLTEAILEASNPGVPWREPVYIVGADGAHGYACRYCIAQRGIKGHEIAALPKNPEAIILHLEREH